MKLNFEQNDIIVGQSEISYLLVADVAFELDVESESVGEADSKGTTSTYWKKCDSGISLIKI